MHEPTTLRVAFELAEAESVQFLTLESLARASSRPVEEIRRQFPTDTELRRSMLTFVFRQFDEEYARQRKSAPSCGHAAADTVVELSSTRQSCITTALTLMVTEPELRVTFALQQSVWIDGFVEDGLPRPTALALSQTIDGAFLRCGLRVFPPDELSAVRDSIVRVATPTREEALRPLFQKAIFDAEVESLFASPLNGPRYPEELEP